MLQMRSLRCAGLLLFTAGSLLACSSQDEPAAPPPTPTTSDADAASLDGGSDSTTGQAGVDAEGSVPGDCRVTAPTACPDPPLRYRDIQPIITTRCTVCHNGTGDHWPLTTYGHVADWWELIRGQMLSCTMPPADSGLTMPLEERERILTWIRCGFPN